MQSLDPNTWYQVGNYGSDYFLSSNQASGIQPGTYGGIKAGGGYYNWQVGIFSGSELAIIRDGGDSLCMARQGTSGVTLGDCDKDASIWQVTSFDGNPSGGFRISYGQDALSNCLYSDPLKGEISLVANNGPSGGADCRWTFSSVGLINDDQYSTIASGSDGSSRTTGTLSTTASTAPITGSPVPTTRSLTVVPQTVISPLSIRSTIGLPQGSGVAQIKSVTTQLVTVTAAGAPSTSTSNTKSGSARLVISYPIMAMLTIIIAFFAGSF